MSAALKLCLALVAGSIVLNCARESDESMEELPADTTAAATGITLADIAGRWDMRSVPVAGTDTTATVYQMEATADGITLFLPDREPIQAVPTIDGDSIVFDAGPYESVRRDGVMVTTHAVYRLEGGRLVGNVTAHYQTSGADSVLQLSSEGTRAP